jgi:hypothetical protein
MQVRQARLSVWPVIPLVAALLGACGAASVAPSSTVPASVSPAAAATAALPTVTPVRAAPAAVTAAPVAGEQVRFVWRDFPVITSQSPQAAEAAQCAYDQGRFWDYHDYLYERAQSLSVEALMAAAAELQLDSATFNRCLDSGRHVATIERDLDDALAHRFRGTPSFLINDQPVIDPPTLEFLQQQIDALLAAR